MVAPLGQRHSAFDGAYGRLGSGAALCGPQEQTLNTIIVLMLCKSILNDRCKDFVIPDVRILQFQMYKSVQGGLIH